MTNHLGNPDLEGMSSCSILLQCTLHMDDVIAIVHVICDEKCKCVSNMHMSSEMNTIQPEVKTAAALLITENISQSP